MERVKATFFIETPLEVERAASMLAEVRLEMKPILEFYRRGKK